MIAFLLVFGGHVRMIAPARAAFFRKHQDPFLAVHESVRIRRGFGVAPCLLDLFPLFGVIHNAPGPARHFRHLLMTEFVQDDLKRAGRHPDGAQPVQEFIPHAHRLAVQHRFAVGIHYRTGPDIAVIIRVFLELLNRERPFQIAH